MVDSELMAAIQPTAVEEEEDETNTMRRRIYHELMFKGSYQILRKNILSPHWAWRERDINWRHVDTLTKCIVDEPFKTSKPPIVQPIIPR